MQKIIPHLWYDKEAKEAAEFYVSVFKDGKVTGVTTLHDTPSGSVETVNFELMGYAFTAISAGPPFKFTPAVSFMVALETKEEVDALWQKLSDGGTALMELASYPFSERYGWVQDRYGLSWQLMYAGGGRPASPITPSLLFTGSVYGRAEEAANFYASVFSARGGSAPGGRESKVGDISRYGPGMEPDREDAVQFASLKLEGQDFAVMESARQHEFSFNEAISLMVICKDQSEIDYYWEWLSADPKAEQCGWLKDKFGLSWQVVPSDMDRLLAEGTPEQKVRVTQAFLKMKKFDIAELQRAYEHV